MPTPSGRITQAEFFKIGQYLQTKLKDKIENDEHYDNALVLKCIKNDLQLEISLDQLKRLYTAVDIKPKAYRQPAGMAAIYERLACVEKAVACLYKAMQNNGFVGTDPADPLNCPELKKLINDT